MADSKYGLRNRFITGTKIPTTRKEGKSKFATEETDNVLDSAPTVEGVPWGISIVMDGPLGLSPIVNLVDSKDICPLLMSSSPPGSWEHALATPCSSQHPDMDVCSLSQPSALSTKNQNDISCSPFKEQKSQDSIRPENNDFLKPAIFAINTLDESNTQLSWEQLETVNQATANLSAEEWENIECWNINLGSDAPTGSKDKGKGVDPHNWGSSNIPDVELENETQQALIDNAKDNAVSKKKGEKKRSKSKDKKYYHKSKKSKKSKKDNLTTVQQPSDGVTEAPTNIAPGVAVMNLPPPRTFVFPLSN